MSMLVTFRMGLQRDAKRLLAGHYVPTGPFPPERIIVASVGRRDVGVLTVSRPTLNGSWRRLIPGYESRVSHAGWLNETVRTISRVVVKPEFRGLGIATSLVKEYLANPVTPYTEAIASMGHISPFFMRAGMEQVGTVWAARDERLRKKLQELNLNEFMLLRLASTPTMLERSIDLQKALHRWANDSRATRSSQHASPRHFGAIAALAARRLVCPPCLYLSPAVGAASHAAISNITIDAGSTHQRIAA